MKYTKRFLPAGLLAQTALTIAVTVAYSQTASSQNAARPPDIVGLGFVGHNVADLERSIKFYEALDFKVVEGPSAWAVDKELNQLGNTPGAETRTATLQIQSSVSDVPFRLILRQYRGVPMQDWSKLKSWDLGANHIDLTIEGSVSNWLDKLDEQHLLQAMPEIQGLPNPRQQPGAFRRYSFISDPDGLTIENFGKPTPKPGDPPPAPTVSNSTATAQNIDRLGKQTGFNHYAVNVVDPQKARDFYSTVLGGDYPKIEDLNAKQIMQNGWYPQATTGNNLRIELVWFALNNGKMPPPIKFQDINANFSGFQVSNIESAYARAKQNGAITVSQSGIIPYHGGRAALIRDSDVGGFIMLWQPAK